MPNALVAFHRKNAIMSSCSANPINLLWLFDKRKVHEGIRAVFWKKRIQVEEYCEGMLKHIFSQHYDDVADGVLGACPGAYRQSIDRDMYVKNFRAAVLQLLAVTFARNLERGQRSDAILCVHSFLKAGAHDEVERLYGCYNSAFGSDFDDGVRAMASLFVQHCAAADIDLREVQRLHYDAFYDVLRAFFENIRSVKVT